MIRTIFLGDDATQARAWLLAHGIEDLVVPDRSEVTLLGTAGAIAAHAPADPEAPILVLRGVPPEAFDLTALLRQHQLGEAALTIALHARESATLLGWTGPAAEMDRSGRILRWSPRAEHDRDLDWLEYGAYVLAPGLVKRIPKGTAPDLVRQLVPLALRSQLVVRGWRAGGRPVTTGLGDQASKPTTKP